MRGWAMSKVMTTQVEIEMRKRMIHGRQEIKKIIL